MSKESDNYCGSVFFMGAVGGISPQKPFLKKRISDEQLFLQETAEAAPKSLPHGSVSAPRQILQPLSSRISPPAESYWMGPQPTPDLRKALSSKLRGEKTAITQEISSSFVARFLPAPKVAAEIEFSQCKDDSDSDDSNSSFSSNSSVDSEPDWYFSEEDSPFEADNDNFQMKNMR